jgi:hypothetical protein
VVGGVRVIELEADTDAKRMLLRAYEFSSTLHGESVDEMEKDLIRCDAFKEPKEGKLKVTVNRI